MSGTNCVITDTEAMGDKADMSHEEVVHLAELTEDEKAIEKKLRLRIDSLIMPLVVLVYLLNYIDRCVAYHHVWIKKLSELTRPISNNYAAAKLQGLTEDLHLTDTQYHTGLSILFVGYILMQVPSNLLLNYMGRPSLYLGFFITAWGLVSALTSQVKGYGSIVACRFLLGLVGKKLLDRLWILNQLLTATFRGSVLCRCAVLLIEVVYQEGTCVPHEYLLLRFSHQRCIRELDCSGHSEWLKREARDVGMAVALHN